MSVQVRCPHCATTCVVADDHIGVPVLCGNCRRSFSVRSPLAGRPAPEPTSLAAAPPPRLEIAGTTSAGRVRDHNEDGFATHHVTWSLQERRRDAALVVVADGLGGHEAGEEASAMVVRTACAVLLPLVAAAADPEPPTHAAVAGAIAQALLDANRAIHRRAKEMQRPRGMGSTAAVVVVREGTALIGHVGDCRVYHYAGRRLTQVTRDQTVAARMVELGRLTAREALTHPSRNDVFQAIGHHTELKAAHYEVRLAAGDWLVAASDGLHAHVDGGALQDLLAGAGPSAADLAGKLVDAANAGGGSDNCTVVAIRCYS